MSRLLHTFALFNLALGTTMALLAASPFAGAALRWTTLVQPGQDPALADQAVTRWVLGIAGGVWAGWGASMVASVRGASVAASTLSGLVVWCALDSLASAANGAWLNVVVNLSWLAFGVVATRSSSSR